LLFVIIFRQYQAQQAEKEFNKNLEALTKDLHHLVSTKQIRGVFNPDENFMEVSHDICFQFFHIGLFY
jgi:hypothetical protein